MPSIVDINTIFLLPPSSLQRSSRRIKSRELMRARRLLPPCLKVHDPEPMSSLLPKRKRLLATSLFSLCFSNTPPRRLCSVLCLLPKLHDLDTWVLHHLSKRESVYEMSCALLQKAYQNRQMLSFLLLEKFKKQIHVLVPSGPKLE
jgi:hypothetical protein